MNINAKVKILNTMPTNERKLKLIDSILGYGDTPIYPLSYMEIMTLEQIKIMRSIVFNDLKADAKKRSREKYKEMGYKYRGNKPAQFVRSS